MSLYEQAKKMTDFVFWKFFDGEMKCAQGRVQSEQTQNK
jgi:hypothetical protein